MADQTKAEVISDDDLDAAKGGVLTSNETIARTDWEEPKTKLRDTRPAWGDATGHFD